MPYTIDRDLIRLMRFEFDPKNRSFICSPESDSETKGVDSNGIPIELGDRILFFDQIPTKFPRSDMMALICLIAFYPFLKSAKRIIFPKPVNASIWYQILSRHQLTTNINTVDSPTDLRSSTGVALSWGGGLDSWAAYQLQPDLYTVLIHQKQDESSLPLKSEDYPPIKMVTTNVTKIAKYLDSVQSPGWVVWVAVLVSCLWLSEEYDLGYLVLGGNLGSTFLQNGEKYYPAHLKPNLWYQTFNQLKLHIYVPLAGLTDLGVIKILKQTCGLDKVKYCWFSNPNGGNCHQCHKCIRKEILMGRYLNRFEFKGPSFDYVRTRNPKLATWVTKYYQPALELIPNDQLKSSLVKSLARCQIEMLSPDLEYLVEHYGWELE